MSREQSCLHRTESKMADKSGRDKLIKAKGLSQSKLRAFDIGNMSLGTKSLSKRELDEVRRKKDQQDAAAVYEEFVASFEETNKLNKSWVKGGVVNPEKKTEDQGGGSRMYKPTSKLATFASPREPKREEERQPEERYPPKLGFGKKSKEEKKKKSNLELFKEELKAIQEEREERHAIKRAKGETFTPADAEALIPPSLRGGPDFETGSHPRGSEFNYVYGVSDTGDETTTNIYVGNINPKMQERELCEVFGKYGPLASVKIMWPRTNEERQRGRNCGFVAFMNRKDWKRAMNALKGKEVNGFEMKLGWGKAVPIPPHPIYIPPILAEMTQPPPPSGLPFNAQIKRRKERGGGERDERDEDQFQIPMDPEELEKTLANAVVKVVIPTERQLLALIHRMVEFVVREGPMFEAMIMNRELHNPFFRFLFDNKSPAHTYYRWKLYSVLHGDTTTKWQGEEFRMFKGGSIWRPPPINPFTQGMPDDLVNREANSEFEVILRKGKLTNSQRDRLEDILRELSPERVKIAEAMVWCLDHAEAAEEIVECISESLSILQTPLPKKIARLFLVSDILFNSSAKVVNASFFRKFFQAKLKEIFKDMSESYEKIEGRLKAEQFKQKVMNCFRAWEDWAIYPNDLLINMQNIFLGLVQPEKEEEPPEEGDKEMDGAPIEDVDGFPLGPVNIPSSTSMDGLPLGETDVDGEEIAGQDLDGLPLSEADIDGEPLSAGMKSKQANSPARVPSQPAFIRSMWEEVDETELAAQAMTSSKWEMLEEDNNQAQSEEPIDGEDIDGMPLGVGDTDSAPGQSAPHSDDSEGSETDSFSTSRSTITDNLLSLKNSQMSEERRQKLREIEVKVVKYQDELEAGRRSRKSSMGLQEQIHHYRRKLQKKFLDSIDSPQTDRDGRKRHRSRSSSPPSRLGRSSDRSDTPKKKKKDKDRSPKRSRRSRSRSPRRRGSRSPGRERKKHRKHRD